MISVLFLKKQYILTFWENNFGLICEYREKDIVSHYLDNELNNMDLIYIINYNRER